MARYLLRHEHESSDCGPAFAAWRGFDSPLRGADVIASCAHGGHELWWTVEAADAATALGQLPPFVAARTIVTEVTEVLIP